MNLFRITVLLLMLIPCAAFAAGPGTARISLIEGDVQVYTVDTLDWVAAAVNMPLREGDRLWVPEGSRAEVQILGGVYIRLGSATALDILALQENSYQFYLNGGNAYFNNRSGGIDHIQVDTPLSSVGCYDNSLVMIDVADDGASDIAVLKGSASAETETGMTRVESGDDLHLDASLNAELTPLAPPDEWENWNRDRDRELASANRSLRYLPEELDDYASELDDNGKWVYVTNYGYCWTPLSVSPGWAPYQDGRWIWSGGDYVWISSDPWGWAPHHYGRWAFVADFGWCWVPPPRGGIYWSPGYVGWVNTPDYVAWVPLAPGDVYYGRGYFGPGSVNTGISISVGAPRHFLNIDVRSAVRVMNLSAFISGKNDHFQYKGNPFKENNFTHGPPAIKPGRTMIMPAIRTIPAASRPPERVKRLSVEGIKRERTLVHEEKGSAFKAGRPGSVMPVRKDREPLVNIRQPHLPLPAATPAKNGQFPPRRDERPVVRQPEMKKETPGTTRALPGVPAPATVREPDRMNRGPFEPAPPRPRQVVPAAPAPWPAAAPPARAPREPRWQEPMPTGPRGDQRKQPAGTRPTPAAQQPPAAPVPKTVAPRPQSHPEGQPRGGEKEGAASPRSGGDKEKKKQEQE